MTEEMINLTIDGKSVSVSKGTTVYHASKNMGIDLPIFCYQDRMPPFGACRVCLVEVEKMPKLQTSCTLQATEGMVVKTQADKAVQGREEILEFLLINHPLDCPICDKGGECPLQDQTEKFGPGKSHFFEEKRHFTKHLPLGPVLMLDRERCVVCARCTRFGDIVAGDHALEFIDRGFKTEVGTPNGGPVESKFIGNTIEICPVGALTSQVYRFRARPWDNRHTPSACTLCPVGCSLSLEERDGEIVRTQSYENKSLNDMWLCDKGWFGYEFIMDSQRLKTPLIRRDGKLEEATWEEALYLIASKMETYRPHGKIAGWGGNPLTVEENYLFQKLMRTVCDVNHVDHRIGMPLFNQAEEGLSAGMEISIGSCQDLKSIYLFGVDITEEFPVIWLRLKEAINRGAKVIFAGHYAPEVAKHLSEVYLHPPGEEIEAIQRYLKDGHEEGAIFVGSQYLSSINRGSILSELLKRRSTSSLNLLEGRGNSMGARLAGMRPDLGPLNKPPERTGLNFLQVAHESAEKGWGLLHVAGANPALKMSADLWRKVREKTDFIVVQDLFLTETARDADVVLPTLSYVEKEGHFINIEKRVQKLRPGKDLPKGLKSDGEIFVLLAERLGHTIPIDEQFSKIFTLERLPNLYPASIEAKQQKIEGDLLATFAHALFDEGVRMEHNKHLIQMTKEPKIRIHPKEGEKRQIREGDWVKANGVKGQVQLDETVSFNTVVLPLGFKSFSVFNVESNLKNGLKIILERIST